MTEQGRCMQAVLYTRRTMEPITVLDIPMEHWMVLQRGGPVYFLVMQDSQATPDYSAPTMCAVRKVAIVGERLRRGSTETILLFTEDEGDEEVALRIKPAMLPGQRLAGWRPPRR